MYIIPGDLLRELAGHVRPRGSDRYGYDMTEEVRLVDACIRATI